MKRTMTVFVATYFVAVILIAVLITMSGCDSDANSTGGANSSACSGLASVKCDQ